MASEPGVTTPSVADDLGLSASYARRLLNRMRLRGLVLRERSEWNRRVWRWTCAPGVKDRLYAVVRPGGAG